MKLPCEIVQDLLPLYEDGLCSPASREAVESHLKECPKCRSQTEQVRNFSIPESPQSPDDKALVRGFRKIRRRWAVSLIAILLVIPVALLSINQIRGCGICYTNIDEIITLWRYARALEAEDFEAAADCMNYEQLYRELRDLVAMSPEDFQKQFIPVTIGESQWMVTEEFYESNLHDGEDPIQIWSYLIYNHIGVMVPLDVWNTVFSDAALPESQTDELLIAGDYVPLETPWGTYMVDHYSSLLEYENALDICASLELVPAEVYEEALPALVEEAQKQHKYIQEHFGALKEMTLEEFTEYVRGNYLEGLRSCKAKGYSLESNGFSEAYFISESNTWVICWDMTATFGGKQYTFTLDSAVNDGGLTIGAFSSRTDAFLLDEIFDALILSYLP